VSTVIAWLTRPGFRERLAALCRAAELDKVGQAVELDTEVMDALHVLARHGAFAPVDEAMRPSGDEVEKPSFALTMDEIQDGESLTLWLKIVDRFFPEGSWAWSAARAGLMTWASHPHDSAEWLRAIESPDSGPLAASAAACSWARTAQTTPTSVARAATASRVSMAITRKTVTVPRSRRPTAGWSFEGMDWGGKGCSFS